jgi:hypothetical protein
VTDAQTAIITEVNANETKIDLVKAKTDLLTFTSGNVDANIKAISDDTVASDNLEAMFDGTGYINDNAPSYQAQVSNITVTGSAVNAFQETMTTTTGTVISGTPNNTLARDGAYYEVDSDAGTMQIDADFDIGPNGVPTGITIFGRLKSANDTLQVQVYDWVDLAYKNMRNWTGQAGSTDSQVELAIATTMVGTGVDVGTVRVRLFGTGLTSATMYLDQIYVLHTLVFRSAGYQTGAVWVDTGSANTGAVLHVDGVVDNAVNTYANALVVADAGGFNRYAFSPSDVITITRSHASDSFYGNNFTVNFNGQIPPTYIENCLVFGTASNNAGTAHIIKEGTLGLAGLPVTFLDHVIILGSSVTEVALSPVVASSLKIQLADCSGNSIASMSQSIFDFTATAGTNHELSSARWSGPATMKNMTAGDVVYWHGDGSLTIDATCTGGTIRVTGTLNIIDNASGAVTLVENARLTKTDIAVSVRTEMDANSVKLNNADTKTNVKPAISI